MVSKTSSWALLAPFLWIAILLLVASGRADGANDPVERSELAVVAEDASVSPPPLECAGVIRTLSKNLRSTPVPESAVETPSGPA